MNALGMFQCLMETCLGNLQFSWCISYLDNIIIFAGTPKELLERFHTVLSQLQSARLKSQPAKCEFFKVSVFYLGHVISKEGLWTDNHKVEAIRNWPVSITITELRSFSGFTNYYRYFIKGYAKGVCPLYDQISGDSAAHKERKVQLTDECQKAFDMLKVLCTSAPILALTDFNKPFKLHTDTSAIGLGAILHQEQDGKDRVIGYASRAPLKKWIPLPST